jgi:hypothetical protein
MVDEDVSICFFLFYFFYHLLLVASRIVGHLEYSVVSGQDKKVETQSKECYMREQNSVQFSASG